MSMRKASIFFGNGIRSMCGYLGSVFVNGRGITREMIGTNRGARVNQPMIAKGIIQRWDRAGSLTSRSFAMSFQ